MNLPPVKPRNLGLVHRAPDDDDEEEPLRRSNGA